MYESHPSKPLHRLFADRPWQGADPMHARLLFVGLDANYARDLERTPAFPSVLDYHADGVRFWQRYGVHHPFLLPGYRGDGWRFHRNFSRIGFTPEQAPDVSFVELLHVPTCGRSRLEPVDFDATHLGLVEAAMFKGAARHVFVSPGVLRLMRRTGRFPGLARIPVDADGLPTLYVDAGRTIHQHLHFSNYGKFQAQLDAELAAIARLCIR